MPSNKDESGGFETGLYHAVLTCTRAVTIASDGESGSFMQKYNVG
jgi:hypothetical protein